MVVRPPGHPAAPGVGLLPQPPPVGERCGVGRRERRHPRRVTMVAHVSLVPHPGGVRTGPIECRPVAFRRDHRIPRAATRSPPCSARCWSPTGVRSPSGRSGPPTSSASPPWRSSRTRTATPCTAPRPTSPTRSARSATRSARTSPSTRCQGGPPGGRGRGLPRLRLPLREPRSRAGVRRRGHHVRRPARRRAAPHRQQGAGDRRGPGGGRAVLSSSAPSTDVDALVAAADDDRFPDLRQGGRGRWRAWHAPGRAGRGPARRRSTRPCARPSPRSATPRCSSSRRWSNPRHIEVQILADAEGNVVHLYERDCSMQRRHQKVIEIAPAPNLDPELRDRICADAVAFAKAIGYVNAGTVEFLLDERGNHVFIEMNPRIQVEHTVTEQVTDRDLVIASCASPRARPCRADLSQDQETLSGAALQCRITTEDPANGFRPDTGVISNYRSPGGPGVRLDGGTTHTGAEVSAHFDSMLVKLTCYGHSFEQAVRRARRAIAEFRIRGVETNLPFLAAVLDDPDFQAGRVTTQLHRRAPAACSPPQARRPRHPAAHLPRRRRRSTGRTGRGRQVVEPVDKLPALAERAGPRRRVPAAPARARPRGVRAAAAGADPRGRHRHDVPRRAPVAARHPGAHPRPARRRPARRAHRAAAALAGVLGRRDLRRRAPVPRRGPVGPARRPVRGRAQHLPADAAARAQHRRLHAVPDRGHRRVRARGRRHRHGHLPDLRRAQRRRADAARDRRRARRPARPSPRWRSATPATCPTRRRTSTRSTTTCASPRRSSTRARTCSRSRTWPGCSGRPPPARWSRRCASASTCRCTCTPTTPRAASSPR